MPIYVLLLMSLVQIRVVSGYKLEDNSHFIESEVEEYFLQKIAKVLYFCTQIKFVTTGFLLISSQVS